MNLECPHCKVSFTATDATPGKFVRCTSCERRFLVAGTSSAPTSDEEFPPELIVFCVVVVLVVLGLVLAAMTTPEMSVGIVLGLGLTLLIVWKRQAIDQYFKQMRRQAVAKRQAKQLAAAQAAAAQAATPDTSGAPAESDGSVEPAASTASVPSAAGASNKHQPGTALNFGGIPGDPAGFNPARVEAGPPPIQPAASGIPNPVVTAPVAPVAPPPVPESESLTAGLSEKYRAFLNAAMAQSQWTRQELEATASQHHLQWNEAFDAINQWSRGRFGDPMLVQEGNDVWVQLPIL